MSSQKVYFITGANRGIGFELLKNLSGDPSNVVIGTTRDFKNAIELNALASERKNVYPVKLDISSQTSIDNLDSQLKSIAKNGIDVFISNSAIAKSNDKVLDTDRQLWFDHYSTNVSGPIEVTKVLKKYLDKKDTKHLVYISSTAGSLTQFTPVSTAAYGQSKAALNFTTLSLSSELKEDGYTVIALHPGVVSTKTGKEVAGIIIAKHPEIVGLFESLTITPEKSASDIINNVLLKLVKEDTGKFFNYDGSELPY